jgi:CheY-like chemotaxis protein/HPt (histidine-containing phosphotransfer) domain-containing protein
MAEPAEGINVVRLDPDIVSLARAYLANRVKDLDTIRAALKRQDYDAIHGIGHNMHGSGRMFGFAELTKLGVSLQQAVNARDTAEIGRVASCMEAYLLSTRIEAGSPDDAGLQLDAANDGLPEIRPYILVVDDDAMSRILIAHYLENAGYAVREAAGGGEALAIIQEQTPPALVLLDVVMPGMNGLEVCRRIKARAESATIPVVLLSALERKDDRMDGMQAGADDFVTKPVSRAALLHRVSTLVPAA